MDKRYLLIIIILIMGLFTLYFITDASYTIGSASATLGEYTFSLPQGFMVEHSEKKHASIYNDDGVYIHVDVINKNRDNYNNTLNYLSSNNIPIISSGSVNINNIVVDSVFYNKTEYNSTINRNESVCGAFFIFEKFNAPFKIEVTHFDFENKDLIIEYVSYIVESINKNYLV